MQCDVVNGVYFEDAVGTSTWGIDLHYPTAISYLSSYTSTAVTKWYFPFRSLYSRNVPNLLMAGPLHQRDPRRAGQSARAEHHRADGRGRGLRGGDVQAIRHRTARHLPRTRTARWNCRPASAARGPHARVRRAHRGQHQFAPASPSRARGLPPLTTPAITAPIICTMATRTRARSPSPSAPLTNAGNYEVFIRWTSAANRATNTPVSVIVSNNPAPVLGMVNQQTNGAQWISLGTFALSPDAAQCRRRQLEHDPLRDRRRGAICGSGTASDGKRSRRRRPARLVGALVFPL